jgi:hypothetical protein
MISLVSQFYCNGHHCQKHPDPFQISASLPASGSVCEPPLPLDVLGHLTADLPHPHPLAVTPASELTTDISGLAVRSLGFNKFCSTSCSIGLAVLPSIGEVCPRVSRDRQAWRNCFSPYWLARARPSEERRMTSLTAQRGRGWCGECVGGSVEDSVRVLVVVLPEERLLRCRVVEGWERGRLRVYA